MIVGTGADACSRLPCGPCRRPSPAASASPPPPAAARGSEDRWGPQRGSCPTRFLGWAEESSLGLLSGVVSLSSDASEGHPIGPSPLAELALELLRRRVPTKFMGCIWSS